ncbi:MAG TPA: hypothetical protein VMQ56_07275 [Terracidiphilus sp.]|nr:hypothetical protein [Terracidiphilus sp.]
MENDSIAAAGEPAVSAAGTGEVKELALCGLSAKAARDEDEGADSKGLVSPGTVTVDGTAAKAAGAAAKGAGRAAKATGDPSERLDAAASACFGGFAGNASLVLLMVPGASLVTALADCCCAASVGTATGNCAWFNCVGFNLEAGAPVPDKAYPSLAGLAFEGPVFPTSAARAAFCDPAILDPAIVKEDANKEGPDPPCADCIPRSAMAALAASGAPSAFPGSALSPFSSPSVSLARTAICACQLERKLSAVCGSEFALFAGEALVPAVAGILPASLAGTEPCPGSERPPTPVSIAAATVMGWIHADAMPMKERTG